MREWRASADVGLVLQTVRASAVELDREDVETLLMLASDAALTMDRGADVETLSALLHIAEAHDQSVATRRDSAYTRARAWFQAGREDLARGIVERALREDLGEAHFRPQLENLDAELRCAAGDYEGALASADRALALLQDEERRGVMPQMPRGDALCTRANVWMAMGLPDLAVRDLVAALALARGAQADPVLEIEAATLLANLAVSCGDPERALELLDDARLAAARAARNGSAARLLVERGNALASLARFERASTADARAAYTAALAEGGISAAAALAVDVALAELALRERDLAGCDARIEHARTALAADERRSGTARLLRRRLAMLAFERALVSPPDPTRIRSLRDELRARLDDEITVWSRLPIRPAGVGMLHYAELRTLVAATIRAEIALDPGAAGAERAVEHLLRVAELGTFSRRVGARTSLEELRALASRAGGGFVAYLPAWGASIVVAIDADGALVVPIAAGEALRAPLRRHAALLATSPASLANAAREQRRTSFAAQSRALFELLVPAELARRASPWRGWTIVGADLLDGVAFEALAHEDGRWLGLAKEIAYAPSLPAAAWLARAMHETERDAAANLLLVCEPATTSVTAGRASTTLQDDGVDRLTGAFDRRAKVLRGADARGSEITAQLRDARALAVVAHGVYAESFEDGGERAAALALAADGANALGLVSCAEVERWAAPPLVELFACETARGPSRLGDDCGAHLVGAFFAGGARCVLASREAIVRDATVDLAALVHDALARGATVGAALLHARSSLATDERWDDPHYWALLAAHGDATLQPFEASRGVANRKTTWAAVAGIAAAALVALCVAWRARARTSLRARG